MSWRLYISINNSLLDWSQAFVLSLLSFFSCPLLSAFQPDPLSFLEKKKDLVEKPIESEGKDNVDEVDKSNDKKENWKTDDGTNQIIN